MAKINSRSKGANGEREFCKWLCENLNIPMPTRNLEQVRSGGSDVIDVEPFFFEVKRCEILNLNAWWDQVITAMEKSCMEGIIPVVAFRKNRGKWEFLISANYISLEKGFIRLSSDKFLEWTKRLHLIT